MNARQRHGDVKSEIIQPVVIVFPKPVNNVTISRNDVFYDGVFNFNSDPFGDAKRFAVIDAFTWRIYSRPCNLEPIKKISRSRERESTYTRKWKNKRYSANNSGNTRGGSESGWSPRILYRDINIPSFAIFNSGPRARYGPPLPCRSYPRALDPAITRNRGRNPAKIRVAPALVVTDNARRPYHHLLFFFLGRAKVVGNIARAIRMYVRARARACAGHHRCYYLRTRRIAIGVLRPVRFRCFT